MEENKEEREVVIWDITDSPKDFVPDPHFGREDGLVAVGGDMHPLRLMHLYCHGFFPWFPYKLTDQIEWYCPLDRFVIFPNEIHISHSMRQLMKKGTYRVTVNEAFDDVILNCRKAGGRDKELGAWLSMDIVDAYTELHEYDIVKSVEVWDQEGTLVGGLYGLTMGNVFWGESMFSLVPSASKLALIYLAQHVVPEDGMIDCQFETEHLKSMGGRHISYEEYLTYTLKNYNEE